jgi:hypothetical protein
MNVGDIVKHKYGCFDEPLMVRRKFFWLGKEKMVCEDSMGEFTKDWWYEFVLLVPKEKLSRLQQAKG